MPALYHVRPPTPSRSTAWSSLVLATALALVGCPSDDDDDDTTQPPVEAVVLRDVIYSGDAGGLPQTGDLFLPGGVEDPPVVVVVHGGGFVAGFRGEMELYCTHLQDNGIAAFNIDYRLVNQGGAFPGSAIDTLDAVRYLRANPDGHPIGGVCATAGASAGGTLAGLATLLDDEDLFTRAGWGPLRGSSDSVGPLIGMYGVWDFTSRLEQHGSVPPMEQEYLGGAPEDVPDRYTFASPIHHVGGAPGPVLLLHGEQDALVEIV
jgi:acetyl esterase/lipase